MTYKGYDITMKTERPGNKSTGYKIFKDGRRVSQMHLASLKIAKYLIDTFLNKHESKYDS